MADFLGLPSSLLGSLWHFPSTLSYFEYWVNPSHCAHLLPTAGPAVTALATSFCIQSSQVAPSPNIHLIVFIVAWLPYISICIILVGFWAEKLHLFFFSSCHGLSIWVSAKQSGEGTGWVSETLCSSSRRSDISCIPLASHLILGCLFISFVTQS